MQQSARCPYLLIRRSSIRRPKRAKAGGNSALAAPSPDQWVGCGSLAQRHDGGELRRPTLDIVILVTLVGSFALLVTTHLALAFGLTLRSPRWRGPVALLVAPLAPYWGLRERMHLRSGLWLLALATYTTARIIAAL